MRKEDDDTMALPEYIQNKIAAQVLRPLGIPGYRRTGSIGAEGFDASLCVIITKCFKSALVPA